MSINWGPGWYAYSNELMRFPEAKEKELVESMIANSASAEVLRYYFSKTGGQVYVKCGRHVSDSERRVHITLQLGYALPPWTHDDWPGQTAHVIDDVDFNSLTYATDVFPGLTADSKKKIKERY
ncbi:hypothetical protein [Sandarakinorhabdus oryzae]|uniref:hypothetical protein n=1 Tax=Sandarakinorhabdus oryzae TaxID=2675220 RepID=UPI0012E21E44|nr:hypothetical protein [Sandarakinorhabdus oryzae]